MSNNERSNYSIFEGELVTDNPDVEEKEEVTITQSELKEIFQKFNLSGKQILNIDKKVFEKLEAYVKQVEQLNDYKRKIARQELEKYIVPKNKVYNNEGKARYYQVSVYVNKEKRGMIRIFSYAEGSPNRYSLVSYRDFKLIIAGTEYDYLSNAFSETGEDEDKYVDVSLWILENGGKVKLNLDFSRFKVTLLKEKNR